MLTVVRSDYGGAHPLLQVVLGVGVAAAGLYGLHQLLYPRLSAWSHQLFSARSAAAEAEAERTAALTAALERLSEGQTRLQQSLDSLASAVSRQQQRPDQLGYAESQADYLALPGPSSHTKRSQQQQYNSIDTYASSSRAAAVRGGGWDPYAPESSQHLPSDGRPGSAASPSGRFAQGNPSGFYGSSATGFEVTPPPMGNYRAPQPPAQYGNASSISNNAGPSGADPGYARRTGAYAGPEASAAGGCAQGVWQLFAQAAQCSCRRLVGRHRRCLKYTCMRGQHIKASYNIQGWVER